MKWPWQKPKKQIKNRVTASDEDCKKAGKLIDVVIYPQIKKHIEVLNKHLEKDGIQVGVEITWIFDKIE
jgi:hypothetical protein